jgi:carbon-monoxide dehydrogenase large subunit
MHEVPTLEVHHLETITDASVSGAKGLGEGATIGVPAAIVNAVVDALTPLGVTLNEFPLHPRRIRAALRAAKAAA